MPTVNGKIGAMPLAYSVLTRTTSGKNEMSDMFLTKEEVETLTGRKFKSLQVEQLRKMVLPFWVNANGVPVVPRSAIEGRAEQPKPEKAKWTQPRFR